MYIKNRIWLFVLFLLSAQDLLSAASFSSVVTVDDVSVTVPAGTWAVAGQEITIQKGERFFVLGAGTHQVKDEPLVLSEDAPGGFWKGTKLQGSRAEGPINALGSFCPETLIVSRNKKGELLKLDKDYLVSQRFALLGLGPDSDVTENDVVYASYQYQVHRLDSIVLMTDGSLQYLQGTPGTAAVAPPEVPTGSVRLLNIFQPYGSTALLPEHLFFIEESSECIETGTTVGRIPKTLQKLENSEKITVVCLGDSVTVGADIPNHAKCYVEQFRAELQKKFSPELIDLHNISLGGSRSIQWLYKGDCPGLPKRPADICDFQRVLDLKPDLVTIEFVNDMTLTPEQLNEAYGKMYQALSGIGAEIILITPHFVHPSLMRLSGNPLRPAENRPLVLFLREFASKHHLGLADAASRWEQSWKEGIPYITLLANHYNHPSAEGDRFFSEELMKCFNETE